MSAVVGEGAEDAAALARAARARHASLVRHRGTSWLTPARAALLDAGWPGGVQTHALRAEMAALPGPAVPGGKLIARVAWRRGLVRPVGFKPPHGRVVVVPGHGRPLADWRTEARRVVLQNGLAAGRDIAALRPELAAMPGPPVPDALTALGQWVVALGLKRPARTGNEEGKRAPFRTAARRAVLCRGWPGGEDTDAMLAEMNALPGPPVPRRACLGEWATKLGLHRPAGFRTAPWRTEARRALLCEAWPAGREAWELRAAMAELPGAPMPAGITRMAVWACELGLRRPAGHQSRVKAGVPKGEGPGRAARVREGGPRWPVPVAVARAPLGAVLRRADVPVGEVRPRAAVALPPAEDGVVRASFWEVRDWAAGVGVEYDGRQMDLVNRRRAALGLAKLVQCEARTEAQRAERRAMARSVAA